MFKDRVAAGQRLAKILVHYQDKGPIVLAIPRGGVPVGFEIAKVLKAPLSVLVVRKLGAPNQKEFGFGAISEGRTLVLDYRSVYALGLKETDLKMIIEEEKAELKRRADLYRQGKKLPELRERVVILVDDGLATGVSAKAAVEAVLKRSPKEIVFAAPVCAQSSVHELAPLVTVVCAQRPTNLLAIGEYYEDFRQVTDEEVIGLLSTGVPV
jgi:putative phosphoribosyl transferase